MGPSRALLKRAVLLDIAQGIGELPTFAGWGIFLGTVLKTYNRGDLIPRDFEIPEADLDQGLLRIFAGKEELLPDVDAWIARVSQGADSHDSTSSSPTTAVKKDGIVLDGVVAPVDCSPASFDTRQVESTAQIYHSSSQPVILTVPSCPEALIWSRGNQIKASGDAAPSMAIPE
jgi:hypothetical protein